MNYAYNQNSQKQALIGTIAGLVKELQVLAPHPDRPHYKGPLFIKSNSNFKAANDQDGMAGSLIMESILGSAFADAVSESFESFGQEVDVSTLDATSIMDAYSEFITDVEDRRKTDAHGQGSFARMSGKSISSGFNMRASISEGLQAFYDDLPKRMMIERNMAYYAKQLDDLDAAPQYQYASTGSEMAA